ncbi:MAG: hypothetical protein AAF431_17395 [Pseudomonadota bacterium]
MNHIKLTSLFFVSHVALLQPASVLAHANGGVFHVHDLPLTLILASAVILLVMATAVFPRLVNKKVKIHKERDQ